MPAFQTKKSVVAITQEVTEGTPVVPSAATDFVPVEDGYELTPNLEQLENAELTGSIGKSKTVAGSEAPTAKFSLYFKASGVEGTEPNYGKIIHGVLGDKSVNATEYSTAVGSTVGTASARATIVSTNNAVNFERGEALLIKDATNGYKVRNVFSTTGASTLNLGFNVANAPGSGVGLGKAILYKPGESHPTFTIWDYRANGGALQAMAGSRVTEMGIDVQATQFINANYSMDGISFYYDPINITATDQYLDFTETGPTTVAAIIPAKLYVHPHELAAAIESAMNAVASDTITVTYSDTTGKFTIATNGSLLSLLWNTGTNAANTIGDKIGFVTTSNDTASLTYTSDNAITITSAFTANFDDSNPIVAKNTEIYIGDFDDITCFGIQSFTATIKNTKTDQTDLCAESGKSGSVITGREITVEIVANLPQYDADKFRRLKEGTNTSMMFNAGVKTGGNWDAGKVVNVYMPTASISALSLSDGDGLVIMNLTLSAYVLDGLGEFYINFL